jgi:hypothetical protein
MGLYTVPSNASSQLHSVDFKQTTEGTVTSRSVYLTVNSRHLYSTYFFHNFSEPLDVAY